MLATRDRVAGQACALFTERGYVETTMADVAAAAGVSVQTLYLRFGGKPALLAAAFDRAVAGDAAEVSVADRAWVEEMRAAADFPEALRILVVNARLILARATPLFTRIEQAAADPEVAELLRESKRRKYETTGVLTAILREKPGFDRRVSRARTTDVLYSQTSEELFRILCLERGWSAAKWTQFVLSTLIGDLAMTDPD